MQVSYFAKFETNTACNTSLPSKITLVQLLSIRNGRVILLFFPFLRASKRAEKITSINTGKKERLSFLE